jgi:hypothetical protein
MLVAARGVAAVLNSEHHWFAIVSKLEVPGARTATLLRTIDVLCGVLVLTLLRSLWETCLKLSGGSGLSRDRNLRGHRGGGRSDPSALSQRRVVPRIHRWANETKEEI